MHLGVGDSIVCLGDERGMAAKIVILRPFHLIPSNEPVEHIDTSRGFSKNGGQVHKGFDISSSTIVYVCSSIDRVPPSLSLGHGPNLRPP